MGPIAVYRPGRRGDCVERGAGHTEGLVSVPETAPGFLKGYLTREMLPDSVALLPPPPAFGSAGLTLDLEVARAALSMCDLRAGRSRRWTPT